MLKLLHLLRLRALIVSRAVQGQKSFLYRIALIVGSIICAAFTGYSGRQLLRELLSSIPPVDSVFNEMTALGSIGIVLIFLIVGAMDMLFAHTINLGQRTGDGEFLLSLPISFNDFFLVKVMERAITDGLSHIMVLPLFIAWGTTFSPPVSGTLMAIGAYILFQLTISSLLTGFSLSLHALLPLSAVKKFVNWVGFAISISFMGAQILLPVSDYMSSLPRDFLLDPHFIYLPSTWFSGMMVWLSREPSKTLEFGGYALLLAPIFFFIFRAISRTFEKSGFSYSDCSSIRKRTKGGHNKSGNNKTRTSEKPRLIKGFFWKELVLLRRDSDLLINGFLLPVSIFLIAAWGIKSSLPNFIVREYHILTLSMMFLGYFHLFGAMNSVGSEGQSISLLASWFITAREYLLRKIAFWGAGGWMISTTLYLLLCKFLVTMSIDTSQVMKGTVSLLGTSLTLAATGVGLSAIFAKFEAKFLQQASTMSGKLLQVIATITIIWASLKENALEAVSLILILVFSAAALLIRAADRLEFMDDSNNKLSKISCAATAYLGGTAVNSLAFALPVIPALILAQTATVEFILCLTLGIVIAVHLVVLTVVLKQTESIKLKEIPKTIVKIAVTEVGTSKSERLLKNVGALSCGIAVASIVQPIFSNYAQTQKASLSQQLVSPATSVILVVCLCLIMPLCEEILFRYLIYGKLAKSKAARYGIWPVMIGTSVLFALFHPLVAAGPLFLAGMVFNILYVTSGELSTAIIAHCGYNLFVIMQVLY